jgi:hypothetical protein
MAAGDQRRLIDFEVQTLGSSSVSFGGLQMQQVLQAAASAPQQQPGSLFSWSPSSHGVAAQQPHAFSSSALLQTPVPQFGVSAAQAAAPSASFSFTPGASAGNFVFGATPQQ